MPKVATLIGFLLAGMALSAPALAAPVLNHVGNGFVQPLYATGQGNKLYVVEQRGRVVEIDRTTLQRRTFFAVPRDVSLATGGEKGLLGFAFDPAYETNGRFYLNLTASRNGQLVSQIYRFTDSRIATEPRRLLLQVNQPYDNHNGGWIDFGPDGNLYIAFGDGGSGNDPQNNAQNRNSLLGKILRLDVSRDGFPADPNRNYAIPADNPYGNEIFAYGLRNPFRNGFDSATGDLYIGDVGQGAREEVDVIRAGTSGQNFGWRPLEGGIRTPGISDPPPPGATGPITEYDHSVGSAITGGYVYRGPEIDTLNGRYIFADFVTGEIFSVLPDGSDRQRLTGLLDRFNARFGGTNPSSFGEDADGNLYLVDYGNGRLYRFDSTTRALADTLPFDAEPEAGAVSEPASLLLLGGGLLAVAFGRRRR